MNVAIIGLGLIGGSLAMALRGYPDIHITGVVRSEHTYELARERHICDEVTFDPISTLEHADLVWLCMSPVSILDFIKNHRSNFQPGTIVTDVCGIKTAVMKESLCLPKTVDFIGCHPMAGKEVSKLENADADLFQNAHFILTPGPESLPEHVSLIENLARYMGFRDIVCTTPEAHDSIIAYTSQLMHIVAVAVCDDPDLFLCQGFEGGSFRDCTRVAAMDVPLWTELFSLNAPALTKVISRLEDNLRSYREVLESGNIEKLVEKLTFSSDRKRQINLEAKRGDDTKAT